MRRTLFSRTTPLFTLQGKIESDRMKLFLDLEPVGASPISRSEILAALSELMPPDHVDLGVIDDIAAAASRGEKVEERRIAKGTPAEPGHDGKLLLLVRPLDPKNPAGKEGVLQPFDNIAKDQIVARLYPPKPGTPGLDVMGVSVPAPAGKALKVSIDSTLRLEADTGGHGYEVIRSQAEGFLTDDGGKLGVRDELRITGDLDRRFGDIDFIGKLIVAGRVAPGLRIKARRGIEIGGPVQGGELQSSDGDIVCRSYVFGGPRSHIVAGRNLTLSVAQEVHADVAGDVTILKEAADCVLRSARTVTSPGAILGGACTAVCGVEAKTLGNDAAIATRIVLPSDIESTPEFVVLESQIANHDRALALLKVYLGPYAEHPERIARLQPEHRRKMEQLHQKLSSIVRSRATLVEKRKELLGRAKRNPVSRVNVRGKAFPGVEIVAGDAVYRLDRIISGPVSIDFDAAAGSFVEGQLRPLECSFEPPGGVEGEKSQQGKNHGSKR